jgi:hypothetical protein
MSPRTLALLGMLGFAGTAGASGVEQFRGGWIADLDGARHVLILKVRDSLVTGTYCWDCSNPANLDFVMDGRLDAQGVSFTLLRAAGQAGQQRVNVRGKLDDDQLVLTVQNTGSGSRPLARSFTREPRKPQPPAAGPAPVRPPYVSPGPPEPLSAPKIAGLWLAGSGPNKQYFIFREVGHELLGLVCGPCDNPYNMAPLDNMSFDADTLKFDIVHEDWGRGIEHGPFANRATATIAKNEMHMLLVQDNAEREHLSTEPFEMFVLGPVRADLPAR